jgi:hypothetical protein
MTMAIICKGFGASVRVGLLAAIILSLGLTAQAQRAIPDDNLGYPVLITLPGVGTGSGFYINATKYTYLVTAKHVLFNPQSNQILGPHIV